jgi:hypothetical protein
VSQQKAKFQEVLGTSGITLGDNWLFAMQAS